MSVSVEWHGDEVLAALVAAAEEGVKDGTEVLLDASRAIVPRDDGELYDSGRASQDGLEGAVSYDTPYAVLRHESDYAELKGGSMKYLERPMTENAAEILDAIADPIRRVVS